MRHPIHYFHRFQNSARDRFPTFVVGTLAASTVTGWLCFSLVKGKTVEEEFDFPPSGQVQLSLEEARLQAMIENAQQSSWQENLDNAMKAQERFMLPNHPHKETPAFVQKIDRRGREIFKEQQQQQKVEETNIHKRVTKFWQ